MSDHAKLALEALSDAEKALKELDGRCCDPARRPCMADLSETLAAIRPEVTPELTASPEALFALLEDAGGQLGRLQVFCCAENRLPLYARMLDDLTRIQLETNRSLGAGH